jgi:hypothetical protein
MVVDREKRARAAVREIRQKTPWLLSLKAGPQKYFSSRLQAEDFEFFVAIADEGDPQMIDILLAAARKGDRFAIDILREHVLRAGMNVSDEIHAFLREFFIDGPPKRRPGVPPSRAMDLRNESIARLVKMVNKDYGINIYRNPEHRGRKDGPMTAIKLVAEELGLSEGRVEEIQGPSRGRRKRRRRPR